MTEEQRQWVARVLPPAWARQTVIEVGSRDVNGTVCDLLGDCDYTGIDLRAGPNVTIVRDALTWRPAAPAWLVLCLNVLEHTPQPQALLAAAVAMTAPVGTLLLTTVDSGFPAHSSDGGALQTGEYYGAVEQAELVHWLRAAGIHCWQIEPLGGGQYGCRAEIGSLPRTIGIIVPRAGLGRQAEMGGMQGLLFPWWEILLRRHDCQWHVVHRPVSVAAGWNAGLRAAFASGADYALVLNDDVALAPETVDQLVHHFERDRAQDDSLLLCSGIDVRHRPQGTPPPAEGVPPPPRLGPGSPATDGIPDFACWLCDRRLLNRVGYLDEHFAPAYIEDLDLHCRILKAGGRAVRYRDAAFWHVGGQSRPPDAAAISDRNIARFQRKWGAGPWYRPEDLRAGCRQHPYNDPRRPMSDTTCPDRDCPVCGAA